MFVRISKLGRWRERQAANPADVEEAAKDFIPRGDEDISIYKVDSEDEARKVAVLFAGLKHDPEQVDITIIPDASLAGFQVDQTPDPALPPFLAQRHWEIRNLKDGNLRRQLASRILSNPDHKAIRLREKHVIEEMGSHLAEPGVSDRLSDAWKAAIPPPNPPGQ